MEPKDKVKEMLEERARIDSLFAETLKKDGKSIDECWKYITQEARKLAKSGCVCMSDEEVLGIAVHYYDEDNLKVEEKVSSCNTKLSDTPINTERANSSSSYTGNKPYTQTYTKPQKNKKAEKYEDLFVGSLF